MLLLLTLACKAEFPEGDTAILPVGLVPNVEVDSVFPPAVSEFGQEGICLIGRGFTEDVTVTIDGVPCDFDSVAPYDLNPDDKAWYADHLSCDPPEKRVDVPTQVPIMVSRGELTLEPVLFTYEPAPESLDGQTTGPLPCCTLDYPASVSIAPGAEYDTFQLRADPLGAPGSLTVELGWGPRGGHPKDGCWTWAAATAVGASDFPGETVYEATLTAPDWPGEYVAVGRASLDGGLSWQYCDDGELQESCQANGGSITGYSEANAAEVVVE